MIYMPAYKYWLHLHQPHHYSSLVIIGCASALLHLHMYLYVQKSAFCSAPLHWNSASRSICIITRL